MQKEEISEILHLSRRNLVNLGRGLFPENFKIKPSPLHYKLSDALVNSDKSVAMAFPRGFGKTTYAWETMATWNVLHRKYRYVMFIASTTKMAEDMFANVKAKLVSHPLLAGMIKILKNTSSKFAYQIDGVSYFLACYGAGQNLRGKRYDSVRPELVIVDDIESTEAVRSEDQRKKLKDWWVADVLPLDVNCRFFFIGTFLHEDCLLANIIDSPPYEERTKENWDTFRFGVLDYDTGEPTWPEKYDESWIDSTRKQYIKDGQLYRFNTEYQNVAVDRQDRSFTPDNVVFYSPEQLKAAKNGGTDTIMVVDPGIKAEGDHDPTVIMTSSMDSNGNMWIENVYRKRMIHHQILDAIVEEYRKYSPRRLFIEGVQAQEYLVQDLQNGTWKGGSIISCEKIDGKQVRMGKLRIHGLEGMFDQKKIYIPADAQWWPDFVEEMVTFPRGKHDDILDCAAYCKMNHIQFAASKIDVDSIMNAKSATVF